MHANKSRIHHCCRKHSNLELNLCLFNANPSMININIHKVLRSHIHCRQLFFHMIIYLLKRGRFISHIVHLLDFFLVRQRLDRTLIHAEIILDIIGKSARISIITKHYKIIYLFWVMCCDIFAVFSNMMLHYYSLVMKRNVNSDLKLWIFNKCF